MDSEAEPMMRALATCAALTVLGCGSGAWKPRVWSVQPTDRGARPIALPIAPNANGTELVLAVLAGAKQLEVASLSGFEIQLGGCVREIAVARRPVAVRPSTETDRIVVRARETKLTCRTAIEQELVDNGGGLRDPLLVTKQACEHTPVDHVVMRYRYEVDYGFVPPDWDEIARWTGARLALGAPHCGHEPKHELRVRLHDDLTPPPSGERAPPSANARVELLDLVEQARTVAKAGRAGDATHLATRALAIAAKSEAAFQGTVDDELASALAAAQFYAIERDVDEWLRRPPPEHLDARWAVAVAADIDTLARRYERIGDLVRVPQAQPWLRAGAARLAAVHEHVAVLLEGAGQTRGAESARDKARALKRLAGGSTR